jgi:hypothetical protein
MACRGTDRGRKDRRANRGCGRARTLHALSLSSAILLIGAQAVAQETVTPPDPSAISAEASDRTALDPIVLGNGAPPAPVHRPLAAERIVSRFDFERHLDDPARAELFDLPRQWDLAQDGSKSVGVRPGYPRWNTAALDPGVAFDGESSIRLETKGGSVCLRLQSGVVPIFPSTQHMVSAKVRTAGMTHARAVLIARYLDRANEPIESSESVSELVAGSSDAWSLVRVTLPGTMPDAAYVQIDLSIVQPEVYAEAPLGKHQLWPQDFAARAWFDDVAVVQLPAVVMSTGAPGNVIPATARPGIDIHVRDLTGEDLVAALSLQDSRGVVIAREERSLAGGRSSWRWEPKFPSLGWYRVVLRLHTRSRDVGSAAIDLIWAPPESTSTRRIGGDRSRFSVMLEEAPASAIPAIERLLQASGCGSVTIPVWMPETRASDMMPLAARLVRIVSDWGAQGREVSLSMPRLPDALADAARLDPRVPLAVFEHPRAEWSPYLDPLLDRLGQSVSRWQVGEPSWEGHDAIDAKPGDARSLLTTLRKIVPGPIVAAPSPLDAAPNSGDSARSAPGPSGLEHLIPVPSETTPDGAIELARDWTGDSRLGSVTFALAPTSPIAISRRDDASRLVKQMVALWSVVSGVSPRAVAGEHAPALAIAQPWTWHRAPGLSESPDAMPQAALAAWRIAAEHLQGRRVLGSFRKSDGVSCWILAPAEGAGLGALVAWRDRPADDGSTGTFEAYLGPSPVKVVDLFGNESTIELSSVPAQRGATVIHRITLGNEPVFIEGVDPGLAQFVAGFSIDPPMLSSNGLEQTLTMNLSNPWPVRVSGRVSVLEPIDAGNAGAWRIVPRSQTFALDPGQRVALPLSVIFSDVEEAGAHPFIAEVEFLSGRDDPPVRVRAGLDVTLSSLYLDVSQRSAASTRGSDLIVEAQITNRGSEPATLAVAAYAPGQPRQRASVTDLQPGATATCRFLYSGAAKALQGQRVSVGVQQVERPGRLNKSLLVE